MNMKTQDILLVALAIGGLYFLTKKKKKGGVATKTGSSGGGGGVGGGGIPQPIGMETNQIDLNITDLTANTPSMSSCIKNPDLSGCDSILPLLASPTGKEDAIQNINDSKGDGGLGDTGGYENQQTTTIRYEPTNDGVYNSPPLIPAEPIKLPPIKYPPIKGEPIGTPIGDVETPIKATPVKASPVKSGFSGNRADGYYAEEISKDRRKGRKDKYDFDGEYGTFVDDSF